MSNVEEGIDNGRGRGVNARAGLLGQGAQCGSLNPRGRGNKPFYLHLGQGRGWLWRHERKQNPHPLAFKERVLGYEKPLSRAFSRLDGDNDRGLPANGARDFVWMSGGGHEGQPPSTVTSVPSQPRCPPPHVTTKTTLLLSVSYMGTFFSIGSSSKLIPRNGVLTSPSTR